MVAPFEADAQLAYMCRTGFLDAVVSEDSDLFVYGCGSVLAKLDKGGIGHHFQIHNIVGKNATRELPDAVRKGAQLAKEKNAEEYSKLKDARISERVLDGTYSSFVDEAIVVAENDAGTGGSGPIVIDSSDTEQMSDCSENAVVAATSREQVDAVVASSPRASKSSEVEVVEDEHIGIDMSVLQVCQAAAALPAKTKDKKKNTNKKPKAKAKPKKTKAAQKVPAMKFDIGLMKVRIIV